MTLHTPIAFETRRRMQPCLDTPPAAPDHAAMVQAYRHAGGLVSSDCAAVLLRAHREQPISQLARWIVGRHIVSFDWQGERLVPLFQFERADMSLRPRVREVVLELTDAFDDDLEVAAWFTSPNSWLRAVVPLVLLEIDAPAVLDAARSDRYLARG